MKKGIAYLYLTSTLVILAGCHNIDAKESPAAPADCITTNSGSTNNNLEVFQHSNTAVEACKYVP